MEHQGNFYLMTSCIILGIEYSSCIQYRVWWLCCVMQINFSHDIKRIVWRPYKLWLLVTTDSISNVDLPFVGPSIHSIHQSHHIVSSLHYTYWGREIWFESVRGFLSLFWSFSRIFVNHVVIYTIYTNARSLWMKVLYFVLVHRVIGSVDDGINHLFQ